jgi:hypothetical protein
LRDVTPLNFLYLFRPPPEKRVSSTMAGKASAAVGSTAWIATEKENVLQLLQQEKEELIFPAQHEMEWLNEHMSEIFSKSNV